MKMDIILMVINVNQLQQIKLKDVTNILTKDVENVLMVIMSQKNLNVANVTVIVKHVWVIQHSVWVVKQENIWMSTINVNLIKN